MFSINTNREAAQAWQAFGGASAKLAGTQARVSTGLRVAGVTDNASAWSIAQGLRGRLLAWQSADQSLARGMSLLDVAQSGATQVVDLLNEMRTKALALEDPTLSASSRLTLIEDLQTLTAEVDKVAFNTEFGGRRPIADTLTQTTVTSTITGYSVPFAPMTPASLGGSIAPAAGGASQTYVRDGGAAAGRVDLYLDAYGVPDLLEIYQSGVRVAATGQGYVGGGGGVGPGVAVSGQNVLSFDYDPLAGQLLEFQFNTNRDASNSLWSVGGVVLQNLASPLPTPTSTTVTGTVTTSVATTYSFLCNDNGDTEQVQARALTVEALGLDAIDWSDPGSITGFIDGALQTAVGAAAYFGQRSQAFDRTLAMSRRTQDVLASGVGDLVDADLGKEGARLQADQARQGLAQQALSIAVQAPRMLLALFRPA